MELRNVGFCGERKDGESGEKPLEQGPHMASTLGFKPGTHWRKASALTTATSLLLKMNCAIQLFIPAYKKFKHESLLQVRVHSGYQSHLCVLNAIYPRQPEMNWNLHVTSRHCSLFTRITRFLIFVIRDVSDYAIGFFFQMDRENRDVL